MHKYATYTWAERQLAVAVCRIGAVVMSGRFPNLAHLACKYLTVCGTSVPYEQIFSHAGCMMSMSKFVRISDKHVPEIPGIGGVQTIVPNSLQKTLTNLLANIMPFFCMTCCKYSAFCYKVKIHMLVIIKIIVIASAVIIIPANNRYRPTLLPEHLCKSNGFRYSFSHFYKQLLKL